MGGAATVNSIQLKRCKCICWLTRVGKLIAGMCLRNFPPSREKNYRNVDFPFGFRCCKREKVKRSLARVSKSNFFFHFPRASACLRAKCINSPRKICFCSFSSASFAFRRLFHRMVEMKIYSLQILSIREWKTSKKNGNEVTDYFFVLPRLRRRQWRW